MLGSAADTDNSFLSPSTSLSLLSPSISLSDHECDIGKLIAAGIVLSQLPRDRKYSVLFLRPSLVRMFRPIPAHVLVNPAHTASFSLVS